MCVHQAVVLWPGYGLCSKGPGVRKSAVPPPTWTVRVGLAASHGAQGGNRKSSAQGWFDISKVSVFQSVSRLLGMLGKAQEQPTIERYARDQVLYMRDIPSLQMRQENPWYGFSQSSWSSFKVREPI
jgi:hypothetical protein